MRKEEKDLQDCLEFLSNCNALTENELASYVHFLSASEVKSLSAKRDEFLKKQGEKSFNIFTSIYEDRYWLEDFHSRVLQQILDPQTFGTNQFLNKFVSLVTDKDGTGHIFDDDVKVLREEKAPTAEQKGYIDILIRDSTHAIIIENKLNDARDMPNQLARYWQNVKKEKGIKDIIAVVYIPRLRKKPPLENYTETEYLDEINKKLVILPATELATDFLDACFLDTCISSDVNETARVYIQQYSSLLKKIGGQSMTKDIEKKLLCEIFSRPENVVAAKNVCEVWEKRYLLFNNLVADELLCKTGLEKDGGVVRTKLVVDGLSVAWWENDSDECAIGFLGVNTNIVPKKHKFFLDILKEQCNNNNYFSANDPVGNVAWITFNLDDFRGSLDEAKRIVLDKFVVLENCLKSVPTKNK